MRAVHLLLSLALLLVHSACLDTAEEHPGPRSWGGPDPHIYLAGQLDGEQLFADLNEDSETSTGAPVLWGVRGYTVESGQPPRLDLLQVHGIMEVAGEERELELELRHADFASLAEGDSLEVVSGSPAADQVAIEWAWRSTGLDKAELYRGAAQEGRFTLGELSGALDADSQMVPEGQGLFGGYLDAYWSDLEQVQMSFSVGVDANLVE